MLGVRASSSKRREDGELASGPCSPGGGPNATETAWWGELGLTTQQLGFESFIPEVEDSNKEFKQSQKVSDHPTLKVPIAMLNT